MYYRKNKIYVCQKIMTDVTGTGTDMWYLDIFWVRTSEVTSVD